MLEFVQIVIGSGGLPRCVKCHPAPVVPQFLPTAEIESALVSALADGAHAECSNVAFVGAEPFAHPELPQVVHKAVVAGACRIRLRTDAGALSLSGNAAGVLSAGVRHIEVVMIAGDATANDALCGRPGLFAAALSGVAAFAAAARALGEPVAVTGLVPVCRHTSAHLTATVSALAAAGAVSVVLEADKGHRVDPKAARAARDVAMTLGVWIHGDGLPPAPIEPWTIRGDAR